MISLQTSVKNRLLSVTKKKIAQKVKWPLLVDWKTNFSDKSRRSLLLMMDTGAGERAQWFRQELRGLAAWYLRHAELAGSGEKAWKHAQRRGHLGSEAEVNLLFEGLHEGAEGAGQCFSPSTTQGANASSDTESDKEPVFVSEKDFVTCPTCPIRRCGRGKCVALTLKLERLAFSFGLRLVRAGLAALRASERAFQLLKLKVSAASAGDFPPNFIGLVEYARQSERAVLEKWRDFFHRWLIAPEMMDLGRREPERPERLEMVSEEGRRVRRNMDGPPRRGAQRPADGWVCKMAGRPWWVAARQQTSVDEQRYHREAEEDDVRE